MIKSLLNEHKQLTQMQKDTISFSFSLVVRLERSHFSRE